MYFFLRHVNRLFHQKFTQKFSPKAYFRLFFHFLTEIAIKASKTEAGFFKISESFVRKKEAMKPDFFPSIFLVVCIRKSLPEIGHLSEQNFFAPLFLQPLHFGPSFVES